MYVDHSSNLLYFILFSRKIDKIPKLGADCVCIDCEDGVSVNMKDQVSSF
jgi:hypothetical protein